MPTDTRAAIQAAARELLRFLSGRAGLPPLRVAEAEVGMACLIQVWDATKVMPTVAAERRTRSPERRAGCRQDIMATIRAAGRPLTRKQVVRALRDARAGHGPGTVAKALADLTAAGDLHNPKDNRGYRLPDWPKPLTPSLFN